MKSTPLHISLLWLPQTSLNLIRDQNPPSNLAVLHVTLWESTKVITIYSF
jgi:hypothetical protein